MGWFVHHLDLFDHYIFQFSQTFIRRCGSKSLRTLNASRFYADKKSTQQPSAE
jgi:hypothetical protein